MDALLSQKRERGTGRLYLRGNTWWCQYYDRGVQVRESTGEIRENERKALKFLRTKLGQVAAGVRPDSSRLRYEDIRGALIADYEINSRKSLRRDASGVVKPLDKVQRLDAFFAGELVRDIDTDLLRKFIAGEQARRLKNGRSLTNGTINRSLSALRRMFHIAKADGKLREIPTFPMLKEARARQGFFEREQYDLLLNSLPDYLRLPLALGYFTGMRLGETLHLQWDQLDFLTNTISLRAGETKNDEARTIPIVPQLRELLIERRAHRQGDCPYVCFRLDTLGRAVRIGSFRKVWQSRCVKLGLGTMEPATDRVTGKVLYAKPRGPRSKPKAKMVYVGMLFHDLRRSGVRNLVRAGVPEKIAMSISGHKTRDVFERYNIVSENDLREAGRKLEQFHAQKVGHISGTECTTMQQAVSAVN